MGTRKIDGMGCPDRAKLARSGLARLFGSGGRHGPRQYRGRCPPPVVGDEER